MTNELTVNDLLMDAPPPKREYHFGIIHVSSMFLHQVGASIRECNTQGELEDKGVFTAVHKLLLLPDSYTIRGMFLRMQDITHWHIWVESPDLPTVEEYSEPPEIVPIYRCDADGSAHLVEIRIEDRWKHTYAPGELTADRL